MRKTQKIFIAGNVGRKPNLKKNRRGRPFLILTLVTNRFSLVEGHWHKVADNHTVIVWDGKAELCEKYLEIGFSLAVEGHIEITDEGRPMIVAEDLHFLGLRTTIDDCHCH